jgi:hypothetical protein
MYEWGYLSTPFFLLGSGLSQKDQGKELLIALSWLMGRCDLFTRLRKRGSPPPPHTLNIHKHKLPLSTLQIVNEILLVFGKTKQVINVRSPLPHSDNRACMPDVRFSRGL